MQDTDIARRIAELPLEQRMALFQELQKQKERKTSAEQAPIVQQPRVDGGEYPLSFAQQRLFFLNQYEPESAEYNIPHGFLMRGPLDPDVLRQAFDGVVARHETLRTTFKIVDGAPVQVVAESGSVGMPLVDLRSRSRDERLPEALRLATEDAGKPFDLARGPLLRAKLFRTSDEEHLLYLNVHHITWDGWSQGIFLGELRTLYDAFFEGDPSPLPDLQVQYLDFGIWQREWLQGEVLARQLSYWSRQLGGVPPLDLPCDRPRPANRTHAGTTAPVSLPRELAESLRRLAQQEEATPFILYCAAYRALLHHYSAQEDFAIGTLIANRRRKEVEKLVGFFANTLALRTDLAGDPTFRELLRRERGTALDAYGHQDLPFEKLVEELNPPRDLSRTPIFQTMIVLQNAPPASEHGMSGLSMDPVGVDSRTSKFDCMLYLTEGEGGVRGFLEYNTDLFEPATVARLLGHFRSLLEGVAANPDLRLSELPLLPEEERKLLLVDWNATAAELPAGETLHGLVARQAAERPQAVAVEMEGERLTYGELEARAGRLAAYLRRLGVGPEVLVGIGMERSLDMVVGLLGILKAGGAYVPLDPEYPKERLAYMIESSALPVLLTQEKLLDVLPAGGAKVVALDRAWPEIDALGEAAAPAGPAAGPDNLAYVIYTSGSTGQPKGVQIPHRAVVNFLRSMSRKPGLSARDTLFAVTTLSFDIAGLELYLPLVNGARVVMVGRETAQAGEQLAEAVARAGTTVMQATPATWRLLLGAGWSGDPGLKVLCGGEALPPDLAEQILDRAGELWNVYGPTEATIWSTLLQVEKGGRISIGRPIDNTQVYLLTRQLKPVPAGVPGELHIAGAGLSRGYRGRPDLTAERFIPDPFSAEPGARVYKTGDLARWLPDGTLEFLGRIDHQVKVRGFRIELGEIEAALAQHPDIRQAVAIVREDTPGSKRIVAYLVAAAKEAPGVSDLRAFLKEKLPEYMIPAIFVPLEELPLTPNGKVDRRSLPAPDKSLLASAREYVAPRTPQEETLAAIWAEVLGLDRVGLLDDFFELGGDSLLVIKVVSKANKAGVGITTKLVFQNRTLGELAAVAGTSTILAEQGPVTGPVPFTPAQRHFLEFGHPNPSFHSLGNLLRPRDRKLNVEALRQALLTVVNHHDNLRIRLEGDQGSGWSLVCDGPRADLPLPVVDVTGIGEQARGRLLRDAVIALIKSQRMEEGNLVKAVVFELGGDDGTAFYLNIQFMAADIGSWTVVLDDLDTVYRQLCAGEPVSLQPKTTSARQWAERLAERANAMPEEERTYWLDLNLGEEEPLPRDFPEATNYWDSVAQLRFDMTREESRLLLQEVPRAYGVQIDGIIMTALALAFERWTGRRSLGFQTVGNGKEPIWDDVDLTRTVGWFNIIFPGRLELGEARTPIESLRLVNQQLRRIPSGGLGYGLLRYLSDDPATHGMRSWPHPELFFNYLGPDVATDVKGFEKITHFHGYPQDTSTRRLAVFMIGGHVQDGILFLKWDYSKNLHRPETVKKLMDDTQEILRAFLADYQARKNRAS